MIKVAIIEDETDIRNSLSILINGSDGFACIGQFESTEEALSSIPRIKPDVVLVDIQLTGKSGIEAVKELKPLCNLTQFVMFTSLEDPDSVFNALKAGATGYLTKTTRPSQLLDALMDVYKGGSPMSSQIARRVVSSFGHSEPNQNAEKLSVREQEILGHLSKGLRYKEIGDILFISTETVRTHIRNIYEKLQVNSRTEALNKVFNR